MYLSGGGSLTHVMLTVSPSITVLSGDVIFIETSGTLTWTFVTVLMLPAGNEAISQT